MDAHDRLLASIRDGFSGVGAQNSDEHGNRAFSQLVRRHRLLPHFSEHSPDLLSSILRDDREKYSAKDMQKRKSAYAALSEITIRAQAADTRFVVIKGLAFEQYVYGREGLRDMGDIDILALPEDAVSMHGILVDMGYRQRKGPTSAESTASRSRRAYLAAHARQIADTFSVTQEPVRRHREKPQYVPYI
jgi:hypothetical protein